MGEGTCTAKTRKRMGEKYLVSHDQYKRTRAPTMKGTLIYSAIRSLNTVDHSRMLHELHQELRNVTRLGLKAYKNLLAMSLTTRHWVVTDTPSDMVEDDWTEDKIILKVQNTQEVKIVKGSLTPRMQDRLKNEESGCDKIRERDRLNALLTNNINTLVREERRSTLGDYTVSG